jgi:metallophosphoesterase (TIGR00282 family)
MMRILFVADIFGQIGKRMASIYIPTIVEKESVDIVIANGENIAGGFGITENLVRKLHSYGVDVITSGNHIWDRKEFVSHIDQHANVLRPFNYPSDTPGKGSTIVETRSGHMVGVLNLQGRTSMPPTECPFRLGKKEIERISQQTQIIFVDFHAEATAEKNGSGMVH